MKFLLDFSESCRRPAFHAELVIWSSRVLQTACQTMFSPTYGFICICKRSGLAMREDYFSLLIVINRLLLDFLYWGKIIVVNTVSNTEWATLTGAEVTFNDSALAESLHEVYIRPDLFLRVPKISVLDQPSPFSLQLSCLLSYFTICPSIRAGGFICWTCWLTSHMPS